MRRAFCRDGLHLWTRYWFMGDAMVCAFCPAWYGMDARWRYESDQRIEHGPLAMNPVSVSSPVEWI